VGTDPALDGGDWEEYEAVSNAIGAEDDPPDGLIVHAAGEVDGEWQSVAVWDSQEAYEHFRDERVFPAVRQALGDSAIEAGPPPKESFEVKHLVER
jgi:heme-degrading monooxygenase HmoA